MEPHSGDPGGSVCAGITPRHPCHPVPISAVASSCTAVLTPPTPLPFPRVLVGNPLATSEPPPSSSLLFALIFCPLHCAITRRFITTCTMRIPCPSNLPGCILLCSAHLATTHVTVLPLDLIFLLMLVNNYLWVSPISNEHFLFWTAHFVTRIFFYLGKGYRSFPPVCTHAKFSHAANWPMHYGLWELAMKGSI